VISQQRVTPLVVVFLLPRLVHLLSLNDAVVVTSPLKIGVWR
jgi:hypothetical protein